jgi:hypothetical protein
MAEDRRRSAKLLNGIAARSLHVRCTFAARSAKIGEVSSTFGTKALARAMTGQNTFGEDRRRSATFVTL